MSVPVPQVRHRHEAQGEDQNAEGATAPRQPPSIGGRDTFGNEKEDSDDSMVLRQWHSVTELEICNR